MGSSGQLYSLSWGEFSSSLASAVQLLRGHGDLVDVTLAAGGRSFPAHKIVLCAASPFLLDLLKSTPCQHPVVMLAGIGADDLESLLEFVYRGEVSVEPSQLPSLLQAAHCLCIHGLTPPTILTENGEEVPVSAIPTANEALSKESITPYFPLKRRKKRRKSSSSSGKWPRNINTTDNENRAIDGSDNSRSTNYDHKDEDNTEHGDDTAANDRLEYSNHRSCHSPRAQEAQPVSTENSQAGTHQDQISDNESHLHTLMPMQPYSPLHIPQFPGPLNMGFPPGIPLPLVTQGTTAGTASCGFTGDGLSKSRSMSDQPASCPLCGAILRQSRNLRRHLELLHFGLGSNNKSGVHMRHRRIDRNNDLVRSTLASICPPHMTRTDYSRAVESTDLSTLTSLSIASTVNSNASNVSFAGSLMGSSVLGSGDQNANSTLVSASSSSTTSIASANNGIYSSDGSASMLNCLLPSLPSLPSLSSPHDMFRHGEMLRVGIAYHDSSRQYPKQSQRTDIT